MKSQKRKQKIDLPYWPSQEFIEAAIAQLKEKGMVAPHAILKELVLGAYRKKREELINKQ